MRKRVYQIFINFVPALLFMFGWVFYCYAEYNPRSIPSMVMESLSIGYKENVNSFNTLLSLNNNSYFSNVKIVESDNKEDSIIEEKEEIEVVPISNSYVGSGNFVLPISGNYIITTYYGYGHNGVDYYSYEGLGSNILSADNGVVEVANGGCLPGNTTCNGGRGNYMVVNHNNGYYTLYMHLNGFNAKVGDIVNAGDVIAYMGNTGYVIPVPNEYNPYGGIHLHFEVYIGMPDNGGYTINPMSLY